MQPNASPFNALPPAVTALAAVVFGVEVMFLLAERGLMGGAQGVGWRLAALTDYGFLPPVLDWMLANNRYPPEQLVRFVSYPLLHVSFTHAMFALVFVLALGKMVAEAFSQTAFLAIFWLSAIVGALVYGLLPLGDFALVGAYPGAFGLIGSYTFLLWADPARAERRWQAFTLIGVLLGIQLLFKLFFGGGNDWAADLAGFATGFALSVALGPGGGPGLWLARLRKR